MHVSPHYNNIKSATFSIEFVATFSIVLNALDNVDARRHVNRLCLAAQVPLIDSGTTGYLGQVEATWRQTFLPSPNSIYNQIGDPNSERHQLLL
jgi:molybdopterin/thiamine biosynthesis adenylyltransferase